MGIAETLSPAGWASLAAVLVWLGLLLARGGFWRADQKLDNAGVTHDEAKPVVAVIPARDEVFTIGRTVHSLLRQDYPGPLSIVVVDDNSSDGTAAAARAAAERDDEKACLHVIQGQPLPEGWSGKLWAVYQGLQHARTVAPDARYVLLTDAEIEHNPGNLSRLVARAVRENRVLVSLMVRLRCVSVWEKILIPAFVFFFQKLYPFPRVNDPKSSVAGAAGGCMLARLDALDAAGGIEAIRSELIDDCALARNMKAQGSIWLGLATRTRSLRRYEGRGEIWRIVTRTAFTQLGNSAFYLLLMMLFMVLAYLWPPVAFVWGLVNGDWTTAGLGLLGWLLMAVAYWPTLKVYHMPRWRSLTLPLAALMYSGMTLDSARRHWVGQGRAWKGRVYR
ncbi:glycosyltransferase [Rhodospira trueperi]|uniref:Hopene-associated glycosyltransferase HpnB n=1 Tax=Rhodospira trueperi TaxID=69960 RepID=A0A1G6XH60_9PROT|nr:glycosyltransferase [Rhodospira trueperi]SDD77549.1 hopene-associated glycosyltransferase HpnB [Rhodospira trueperi]